MPSEKIEEMLGELEDMERAAKAAPWTSGPTGIMHADGPLGGWIEYHGAASPTVLTDFNSEFIAAARNALPTLLKLARLAIEAREYVEEIDHNQSPYDPTRTWLARFDALLAPTQREDGK